MSLQKKSQAYDCRNQYLRPKTPSNKKLTIQAKRTETTLKSKKLGKSISRPPRTEGCNPLGRGKSLAKPPNRSLGDPNLKERTSTKNPVPRDITKGNPKDGKKSSKRKTGRGGEGAEVELPL